MRKTLLYLVILALLGYGIWFFIVRTADSPYSSSEAGFTIKDTASIGKIFLAANDGDAILLERTNAGWIVNKSFKALPSTLNLLLQTLYEQAPLYPVTKAAFENAVKNLSTDGIKVEVYDRAGKKMRVFYVGGTAVNNIGTNMMMEGAKTPYVVTVQSFNGYLTPRYATRVKDWRDRTIFNLPGDEIKSVSVQYADKPMNSFVLTRDKDSISVKIDPEYAKYAKAENTRRAKIYLNYFTNINCEGYLNGVEQLDSIIHNSHKHSTLDIEDTHGHNQHLDIYWVDINKRSKNLTVSNPDVPDEYDADRLIAVTNKDTLLIQQLVFRNIFHKGYEFYQADNAQEVQPLDNAPRRVIMEKKQH